MVRDFGPSNGFAVPTDAPASGRTMARPTRDGREGLGSPALRRDGEISDARNETNRASAHSRGTIRNTGSGGGQRSTIFASLATMSILRGTSLYTCPRVTVSMGPVKV